MKWWGVRVRSWVLVVVVLGVGVGGFAQDPTPVVVVDNPPNTAAQQAKHYVVMVSLDGFRYDYPVKYGAPHLLSMAAAGASAPDGMLPSYPSLTFPNHITLVTGLYPEHHGIVANSFYDPARTPEQGQTYVYTQTKSNSDGSWYSGTPLWVLAEQQGMRSACLFWPGSEAEIQGKRPSYYLHFDDRVDEHKRVDQIVAWLKLPPEMRPHFITLYYSDVDHAGHSFGPDSVEVKEAVHRVDDLIGELQTKLAALNLPVDLIVVADHGMVALQGATVNLNDFAHLDGTHTEGQQIYAKTDADAARIYEQFKARPDPRFSVYRRAETPANLHFDANPREGDPIVVANGPFTLSTRSPGVGMGRGGNVGAMHGSHGFDPHTMPEMKAIFFADGPDIKAGVKLAPFENVNVYPFVAGMLGLKVGEIDGKAEVLHAALADSKTMADDATQRPIRADASVTAPILIHSAEPKYSKEARRAKLRGVALLNFWVGTDGLPTHISVVRGTGTDLDQSAIEAVKKYRFKPAIQNGKPVVVEINSEVHFQ